MAATRAVEAGVDGIIVSNHGARQLDFAPATVSVLEEVSFFVYYYIEPSNSLPLIEARLLLYNPRTKYYKDI